MPASDPITAVANAVTALTGIAGPLIAEHEAQAHEQERVKMVADYAAAASRGDVDRMHACSTPRGNPWLLDPATASGSEPNTWTLSPASSPAP